MPLLEAFLALALTMLSLAMVATLLVEGFHRLFHTRGEGLKQMLEQFYDKELRGFVQADLNKTGRTLETHRKKFIEDLSRNPLYPPGVLASLPTVDFFKRLAYTDIGKHIKAKGQAEINKFVDSMTSAYDAFGDAATELFKRNSRFISYLAGLLVALGLNVNAIIIFQAYLDNPQARAKAVAQAEAVAKKFEDRVDKSKQAFKDKEEIEEYVKTFKQEVADLEKMGITVGYGWEVPPTNLWTGDQHWGWKLWFTLLWLLGVLGTGFLIGLGGPFWFDIVRKLTDLLRASRGGPTTSPQPQASRSPATPVAAVEVNREIFNMTNEMP